jgi:hypothetical protein
LTAYIPSAIHRPDALSGAAAEIAEAPATRAPDGIARPGSIS